MSNLINKLILKSNNVKHCNLNSIIHFSTVDWHGHSSITLFFNKCQFRCQYCYNFSCFYENKNIQIDYIENEISKASKFVNCIVFLGGEPLIQLNQIIKIACFAKKYKMLIGIHTNGYNYKNIKKLIKLNIIDKFFIDIKCSFEPKKYLRVIQTNVNYLNIKKVIRHIKKSIKSINNSNSELEIKTTIFPTISGTKNDIINISKWIKENISIKNKVTYVLQQGLVDNSFNKKLQYLNKCSSDDIKK